MELEQNLDNLVNKFSKDLKNVDPNVISQLASDAMKNNDDKMDKVTNSFNENKEVKKDDTTEEELSFYKGIMVEPVESSNIEGISYLPESKILKIRFKGGGEYIYKNVEELQYKNIQNAKSIGKYFNDNIKAFPDKYKFMKL